MQQELNVTEVKEKLELNGEQEKNPYETMLTQDVEIEKLKPGTLQLDSWSGLNDADKYVQYNQHPLGHYEIKVKATEEKYGTKMYKRLEFGERKVKEASFDPTPVSLKQDYINVFEEIRVKVIKTAKYNEKCDIQDQRMPI